MASWQLDPNVSHLNHGSFGAAPVEVLAEQARLRTLMEANPVSFMLESYQPLLDEARKKVAGFVGADSGGVVFVPNATYGVNSVLRSLEPRLASDSEILVTNHGYNACNNAVEVTASRSGASMVVVDIPLPVSSPDEIAENVLKRVSHRTALVVIDHVTSPTGIVIPVDDIVRAVEPEIPVLVDGAHAPGMIELDLSAVGASFYTANCHKWMCAPKGSGFLHVTERYRDDIHAAVISHGHNDGWPGTESRFHAQFDWTGTDDPTARLSVGAAIDVMENHRDDGWQGIRRTNHELVLAGRQLVADGIGSDLLAPASMIGSTAAIALPPATKAAGDIFDPLMLDLRRNGGLKSRSSPGPIRRDG